MPLPIIVDLEYVREQSSAFTKLFTAVASKHRSPHLFWYSQMPGVVDSKDTLLGAFGLTDSHVQRAKMLADEARNWLTNYRNERNARRLAETAETVKHRTAMLRIAMGAPENGLQYRSIKELEALHPLALESTGIAHYIDERFRISQPLPRIIQAIRYLQHAVGSPSVSTDTLDLYFGHISLIHINSGLVGNYSTFDAATPATLRAIDEFRGDQFEIDSVITASNGMFFRCRITTKWANGPLVHVFNLGRHEICLGHAQLAAAGVINLPELPDSWLDETTYASASAPTRVFLGEMIQAALKSKYRIKRIIYEILGLAHAFRAILNHHHQPIDWTAQDNAVAEEGEDAVLLDIDDDAGFHF